jgi:hypothetical protein
MYTAEKDKGARKFVPITPEYHHKKHNHTWSSIGSAVILISLIVAILLGFWKFVS